MSLRKEMEKLRVSNKPHVPHTSSHVGDERNLLTILLGDARAPTTLIQNLLQKLDITECVGPIRERNSSRKVKYQHFVRLKYLDDVISWEIYEVNACAKSYVS